MLRQQETLKKSQGPRGGGDGSGSYNVALRWLILVCVLQQAPGLRITVRVQSEELVAGVLVRD